MLAHFAKLEILCPVKSEHEYRFRFTTRVNPRQPIPRPSFWLCDLSANGGSAKKGISSQVIFNCGMHFRDAIIVLLFLELLKI